MIEDGEYISEINNNNVIQNEIIPAFDESNIPIVLVSSDQYIPYVAVLLKSIQIHSSKEKNYDILIFKKSVSDKNKQKLKNMFMQYENNSIRFINIGKKFEDIKLYVASTNYSEEAYYRIVAPWVLNNYKKAIVMDSDIIACGDIAELFSVNIEDYFAGAVKDLVYQGLLNVKVDDTYEYTKEVMKMKDPYSYINTGVLLMNLDTMRNGIDEKELMKLSSEHKFRIQEQDILNIYLEDKIRNTKRIGMDSKV